MLQEKKKKKIKTATSVSTITVALRKIWQWSPERKAVIKRAAGHCEECGCQVVDGKKKGLEKGLPHIEIHHVVPCDLTNVSKYVHSKLFPGIENLDGLCGNCHKEADKQNKGD